MGKFYHERNNVLLRLVLPSELLLSGLLKASRAALIVNEF
jgi:hypothetical protein